MTPPVFDGQPFPVRAIRMRRFRCWAFLLAVTGMLWTAPARAQAKPDPQAEMMLSGARKAYAEKNYPQAEARFREFLAKFGNHSEAPAARYGLALTLFEIVTRNYAEIRDLLQPLAAKDHPDRPLIVYHLSLALRGLGAQELALADAKPQEGPLRRQNAQRHFDEARQQFALAESLFAARKQPVAPDAPDLPNDWQWAARARCDQADLQLRSGRLKEARALAAPFLRDAAFARSRWRDRGRYYLGLACFLLSDYAAAEQALTMLAPFADPEFGTHARYLLARTHHLAEERAEASLHYEGVVNDHGRLVKEAVASLKQPDKLKDQPIEKARLEQLARGPAPDHVGRSLFYLGTLQFEAGKFGEARGRFAECAKLFPASPWRVEAELRFGICQVQLKEFGEAAKTLSALAQKEPRLADQALWWLAKVQAGAAPDATANPKGHAQALHTALTTFRQAANRAQQLTASDPHARVRGGEILLDLADTHVLLQQPKEAAALYQGFLNDKLAPSRADEALQRLATALHLAGDYDGSDKACALFQEKHLTSTLLPAVLFRYAENAVFRTRSAENNPKLPDRDKEVARLRGQSVKRLQDFVDQYPEFPHVNLARFSLGLTLYRQGELDQAQKALAAIPEDQRSGELATAPYVLADCQLRTVPAAIPEDALAVGKMEDQLKTVTTLLDAFTAGQPSHPQTADALLKLGFCHQRRAALQGQPAERNKLLTAGRAVYDRLLSSQFKGSPLQAQAVLERAKCTAQLGDVGGAINELRKFTADPWRQAKVAPMGLIQLATLLRAQNQAPQAADILAKGRELHEASLAKDPERSAWMPLLHYHHGLALREAGKLAEARGLFELVIKEAADQVEAADAALRLGQCLKDEGQQKLQVAGKQQTGAKKPEEIAVAAKTRDEAWALIRQAVLYWRDQAEQWKKQPAVEARARMLYEAAWGYRLLAQPQIAAAGAAMQQELLKTLAPAARKFPLPTVPLVKIPFLPDEIKAQECYQAMIEAFPELPLAVEARLELAELLAQREHFDPALALLFEALDREPPAELTERIRLRLGTIHAGKGNIKGALAQFDAVAANPKSTHSAQAHARAGECLIDAKQYQEAIKRLSLFVSQPPLQNLPGVTDRALLRLGHAWTHLQNWSESRRAHVRLTQAFPGSPWLDEAHFGIGWSRQQQKQYDQAISSYAQVVSRTATELGAKAQLQIGLCRLEEKKYEEAAKALLVVPATYDYPELNAAALVEAARAFAEMKQADQTAKLLEQVLRDHAGSSWANIARERLKSLRPTEKK